MNKFLSLLIIIVQIHYLNFSKVNKNNLKEKERKLTDLSDDIVIIHLNDVHCGINETIGYDGFVLYRDELKKQYKTVITADVGDHLQGGSLGAITEGGAILEIMQEIQFDVNTIGNHEFDYGVERLVELNEGMPNKYICANFRKTKESSPFFSPYRIVNANGKKIGFVGVVTPYTFTKTYLSSIRDTDGTPVYNLYSNKDELYNVVQANINKMKNEEGADYVVLLTHLGMFLEDFSSDDLVAHLENVDVVLDGHSHQVYTTTSEDKNGKNIYMVQAGTKLANIGQIIIKSDGTITTEIITEVPQPTHGTEYITINRGKKNRYVSPSMNSFINNIWNSHKDELNVQVGYIDFDMKILPEDSTDSQTRFCLFRECSLGNLITDSIKEVVHADIALINGGGVRANLLKGTITRQKIIDIMPFFNSVFLKEVTGQSILDALEFGVSQLPRSFAGFPQVSGITYDVNTSIASTVVTDQDGIFIRVGNKRRVSNVKINGESLIPEKKYNLSSSEFVLSGGDGYSMFSNYKTVNESIFADSDALQYYIINDLGGTVPINYEQEGNRCRINQPKDIGTHTTTDALVINNGAGAGEESVNYKDKDKEKVKDMGNDTDKDNNSAYNIKGNLILLLFLILMFFL